MSQKNITVKYFALLKEKAGTSSENVQVEVTSTRDLFEILDSKYGFGLDAEFIKVAVNDEFAHWDTQVKSNDEVVFMTPVAGG